jgi:hypothetical protein
VVGGTTATLGLLHVRNKPRAQTSEAGVANEEISMGKALYEIAKMMGPPPTAIVKRDDQPQKQGGFSPSSAALGVGTVGGALLVGAPAPRSPMTNRGRAVRRKLETRARIPGGRVKMKVGDFAEISGGRGYRPKNDAYTARMAQAMKAGKIKQNRLRLDIYDDNIVQRDGAHRAHAAAMRGQKVKVKVIRHKGQKAPKHMTGINMLRDEIVQGRHRSRLKKLSRSGGLSDYALNQLAGKPKKGGPGLVSRMASHASSTGKPTGGFKSGPLKGASKAGVAGSAAILGTSGLVAARMGSVPKSRRQEQQ